MWKLVLTLLMACVPVGWCVQPTMDPILQSQLGDHGDRISDLETTLRTLGNGFAYFQKEFDRITSENLQLKSQIQDLETACYNNTNSCCSSCNSNTGSSVNTNGTMTSMTTATPAPTTTFMTTSTTAATTATSTTASTTTATTTPLPTTPAPTTTSTTLPPTTTEFGFRSCAEATKGTGSGVFRLSILSLSLDAFCDGEWLVIQRRQDGSEDFNRTWQEYAQGFGDLNQEFWFGNTNLNKITLSGDYTLRIEFTDWARNTRYAEYEHFRVMSEQSNFRLSVASYSGDAGDSFHYPQSTLFQHHMMQFSTYDRDNDHSDENCAKKLTSGWWFNSCYSSNLNGPYLPSAYGQRMLGENGEPTLEGTGVEWFPYRHRQYSMKTATMKIKPSTGSSVMIG